jgi:hypothetical protein
MLAGNRRCGKYSQIHNTCYVCVNVKLNGILKFARTVKIRGFDTFFFFLSRGGRYRVSYGRTLKMSSRTRRYGVYMSQAKET